MPYFLKKIQKIQVSIEIKIGSFPAFSYVKALPYSNKRYYPVSAILTVELIF